MATNRGVNIPVTADVAGFINGMGRAADAMGSLGKKAKEPKTEIDRLNQSLRQTEKDLKNIALSQGENSSAFRDAAQRYRDLKNQIDGVHNSLVNVGAAPTQLGRSFQQAAGGFNSLGNSITQITREMPSFTYSMQTGFLALSNNIPIFADEVSRLVSANKALAASGQPVQSVFSQVTTALFSWQTALSVGITSLVAFTPMIADYIASFTESANATNEAADALRKFNLEHEKYIASGQRKEEIQAEEDYNKVSVARKLELLILTNNINLAKKYNQAIAQDDLDRQKLLKSQLLQEYEAYQLKLSEIRKKYRDKEKQEGIVSQRVKLAAPGQLETKRYSMDSLVDMANNALGENTQIALEEGWAKVNAKNLKGMAEFKANWDGFKENVYQTSLTLGDILLPGINAVSTLFDNVAMAIVEGGDNLGEALASSLLSAMGNFMKQWGAQLILVGIGAEALKASLSSLNGVAAIAAGTALLAAGAAAIATANSFAKNSSGSSGYSGGGYSPSFVPTFDNSNVFTLDGRVRGQDLIISSNNTRRDNRR